MGKLFGTDGVRGVANTELTPELAFQLGKAGAYVLGEKNQRPKVLIAKDTRISGDMLEAALSAGILAVGGDVISVGVLPTPAVAYLVKHYGADAGVVISASHNPYEYNGIKFFNGEGFKLDDEIEDKIESMLDKPNLHEGIVGEQIGTACDLGEEAEALYAEFLISTVDTTFEGMKVVLDCANGAAYKIAEKVFQELGAQVTVICNEPNGVNINSLCGSTHPEKLQEKVKEVGAQIGLAFDGDADRLIAVDEKGNVVNGDQLIYICAKLLKEEGLLKENIVTATVMSNMGFYKAAEKAGIQVETTQVGDRYVLESMLKTGSIIGGEQSGHIILLGHTTTGDGVLSALQLLKAVKKAQKSISTLAGEVTIYPQVLKNAKVKNENKKTYMEHPGVKAEIQKLESAMNGEGRILIRPSGTEPLVRVMIEGEDIQKITDLAEELAQFITKQLG